jgi:IPT/TIG domain
MMQRTRKRVTFGVLALVTALLVLPVSFAGTSSGHLGAAGATGPKGGPQKAHPSGRVFGVVPASRSGHRPRRADYASSAFASTADLSYHNGPVMHTNKAYAIYWVPPGYTVSPRYESLIDQYFTDVATASGASSNVYASDTQYYDNVNGNILYSSATPDTFGGSYLDTSPLPPDGCTDSFTSVCLTDSQLQTEIQRVAKLQSWVANPTTMFFIFTADDIGSCIDSTSSVCAFEYYCAYHSNLGTGNNELLYGNIPYADAFLGLFCDAGPQPNGDDADATLNLVSHEHNEGITDPLGNAWYDSSGNENGDKCAWDFGTPLGSTQFGPYNQVINGHYYNLQQEWSNAGSSCVLTYQQASAPPPTVASTSPSSLAQGAGNQNVTVIGGNFVSGATASFSATGIAVNSTSFIDASHLTANVTVAANATTGAGNVTVTNPGGGGSGSCSGCFTVTPAVQQPPKITGFTPARGHAGTLVTINGTNFNGVTVVIFNQTAATSYTRVSSTRITATVPGGATTGPITVTASGGSATSAKAFRVR